MVEKPTATVPEQSQMLCRDFGCDCIEARFGLGVKGAFIPVSEYVFILGAGASRHAGAPLMADFLDQARRLYAVSPRDEYAADLERVFKAISKLQAVHSKSELDIINLESVFSAFEMSDLLEISPWEQGLLRSMTRLITWTLDQTVHFQVSKRSIVPTKGSAYRDFAKMISRLSEGQNSPTCTVITFNYDLAVDMALRSYGLNPDHGLTETPSGAVNLFKLHGSVDWRKCPKCRRIVDVVVPQLMPGADTAEMSWSSLSKILQLQWHCCEDLQDDPVIVPPSWDKTEYRSSLVKVWKRAAAELKSASTIIVCGYSLPPTDSFFRYLYGLGTVGEEPLERFWVFDPAEDVHRKFRELLGPGARARFEAYPLKFEQSVGYLSSRLT